MSEALRAENVRLLNTIESLSAQICDATRERDEARTDNARLDDATRGALDDLARVRAELAAMRAAVREYLAADDYAAWHDVDDADVGNCTLAEFSSGVDRLTAARDALRKIVEGDR